MTPDEHFAGHPFAAAVFARTRDVLEGIGPCESVMLSLATASTLLACSGRRRETARAFESTRRESRLGIGTVKYRRRGGWGRLAGPAGRCA